MRFLSGRINWMFEFEIEYVWFIELKDDLSDVMFGGKLLIV